MIFEQKSRVQDLRIGKSPLGSYQLARLIRDCNAILRNCMRLATVKPTSLQPVGYAPPLIVALKF